MDRVACLVHTKYVLCRLLLVVLGPGHRGATRNYIDSCSYLLFIEGPQISGPGQM